MTCPMRFEIDAAADPQTLPRLINYVAQQGLIPTAVRARTNGLAMVVTIEQAGLSDHQARIIAEKMHSSPLVAAVRLERDQLGA